MPRRNHTPKHRAFQKPSNEQGKVRYATKRAAEAAIRQAAIYTPDISLRVYQSPQDGGWYLTSNAASDTKQINTGSRID